MSPSHTVVPSGKISILVKLKLGLFKGCTCAAEPACRKTANCVNWTDHQPQNDAWECCISLSIYIPLGPSLSLSPPPLIVLYLNCLFSNLLTLPKQFSPFQMILLSLSWQNRNNQKRASTRPTLPYLLFSWRNCLSYYLQPTTPSVFGSHSLLSKDITTATIPSLSFKKRGLPHTSKWLIAIAHFRFPQQQNSMEEVNVFAAFMSSLPTSFGVDWKIQ